VAITSSSWRHRRVFVTGCTGLLGAWLTAWLADREADVVGLVRDTVPRSNFYRMGLASRVMTVAGALEDHDLVERVINEYEIEVVFHLAAQTIVGIANADPRSTFSANVQGTWNVLEAVRRAGARVRAVVVASSDKAYGAQPVLPYQETTALEGRHPYDVSKSCADLIAQSYWHTYRLPVAVTRCGNFFGGGDLNFNRIVPGTIRSLLHGERPVIRSDGSPRRDYFYIEDGVAAYVALAEQMLAGERHGEAYNFSNEQPVSVREITDLLIRLVGRPDLEPVVLGTARNEIPDQFLSAEKARKDLGWAPAYGFEGGLRRTVDWYRAFFGLPA
jgi:CDP-glucose 4,6-dehydratase